MSLAKDSIVGNTVQQIRAQVDELSRLVAEAAQNAVGLYHVERRIFESVLKIGHQFTEAFIQLQGNGDLGERVESSDGRTLYRSESPHVRKLRTIFGEHEFGQFVYSQRENGKIELLPLDARMALSEHTYSYLMEEFSQMFCVESAFALSAKNLHQVFGGQFSVNTLELTTQRMGSQAEEYLDNLPRPKPEDEGELLVCSADGKGVPTIRQATEQRPAMAERNKRPGNRKMATVAAVYSVDRHHRTGQDVVAALFREDREKPPTKRPEPQFKHVTAHFSETYSEDYECLETTGPQEAFAWIASEVGTRRQSGQVLIVLLDGGPTLWDQAGAYLPDDTVPILDLLHAAQYVWKAAHVLYAKSEESEAFARERVLWLLEGRASSVIRGLRHLATQHKLPRQKRAAIETVCNYLTKHLPHLRYDIYLKEGYPIASGVIEGACRHLVKDRMERSGMRWTLRGAKSMLNVRAVQQSTYWNDFHDTRRVNEQQRLHPNRHLLQNYKPAQLAA